MSIKLTPIDYNPLHNDVEIEIIDEDVVAELVAHLAMGYYSHVKSILDQKNPGSIKNHDHLLDRTIGLLTLSKDQKPYRRDGWVFQMISWLAIYFEYLEQDFLIQPPHDAPGQHGIDGLVVVLDDEHQIKNIIVTEDKCSHNPRYLIENQVWPEFKEFEKGIFDNKLISRISALFKNLDEVTITEMVNKDIFRYDIRKYRVGTTPLPKHKGAIGRADLFADYEKCISGPDAQRRHTATFEQNDIRAWMETFSKKVTAYLKSKKTSSV